MAEEGAAFGLHFQLEKFILYTKAFLWDIAKRFSGITFVRIFIASKIFYRNVNKIVRAPSQKIRVIISVSYPQQFFYDSYFSRP